MERKTGVVVPLSALYTKDCAAVGDFPALKDFADFAKTCGFSVIQLLPVNDTGTQSSPYSGLSAFALHPLYIRIAALPEFEEAYKSDRQFAGAYRSFTKEFKYQSRFDYDKVLGEKLRLLHRCNKEKFPERKSRQRRRRRQLCRPVPAGAGGIRAGKQLGYHIRRIQEP